MLATLVHGDVIEEGGGGEEYFWPSGILHISKVYQPPASFNLGDATHHTTKVELREGRHGTRLLQETVGLRGLFVLPKQF